MGSVSKEIYVWVRDGIVQADNLVNGVSKITNLSAVGGNASSPQIAIDNLGNAIAVWSRSNGSNNTIIQARRYTYTNGSWLASVDLSAVGGNAQFPQIAIDKFDNAIAVWSRYNGSNGIIQSSRYTNNGSWLAPVDLSETGRDAESPQIAIDNTGNAIAVWRGSNGSNGSNGTIQASRYTYNGSWLAPNSVANLSDTGGNADYPQIAIDNLGNAIAVWRESNGSNGIIQASRYTNGSWLAPALVANLSAVGGNAQSPQIAIDNTGNAIAVWTLSNGSNFIIQASRYTYTNGSWSTPANLSATDGIAISPQIAIDNYVEPTTKTTVRFSINGNYNTIIIDPGSLENYENDLIDQIVAVTGAPRSSITIISVTNGSIVNELTLPTEYVAALQNAVNNGSFFVTINGVRYMAIPGTFVIVDNICFQKGTMILTPNGYKAVETLKKDETVNTAQGGIVQIQKITSFVGKQQKCPLYVLNKGSLAPNMPLMDLYMSEGHAYRHNGKWSHMKCSSLAKKVDLDNVEYYNIAVDNYIKNTLIANGVEVESLFNIPTLKMTWHCKTDNCKPIIEIKK